MADAVTGATTPAVGSLISTGSTKSMDAMDGMDFMKLLITQLTNQDPMEPMKNEELLQQLSTIRAMQSNMTMSQNMTDMTSGLKDMTTMMGYQWGMQQLSSASQLIGHHISGLDTKGVKTEGVVEGIILDNSSVRLKIGAHEVDLRSITGVETPTTPPKS